jgi:hypothetical protein
MKVEELYQISIINEKNDIITSAIYDSEKGYIIEPEFNRIIIQLYILNKNIKFGESYIEMIHDHGY